MNNRKNPEIQWTYQCRYYRTHTRGSINQFKKISTLLTFQSLFQHPEYLAHEVYQHPTAKSINRLVVEPLWRAYGDNMSRFRIGRDLWVVNTCDNVYFDGAKKHVVDTRISISAFVKVTAQEGK